MNTRDLAWLAGILEGEGYFGTPGKKSQSVIKLAMSDEDVIRRAAALMGTKVYSYLPVGERRKVMWNTTAYSSKAASWMMTLWPFIGHRRQKRILEALTVWRSQRLHQPSQQIIQCFHTQRQVYALGMCSPCYQRNHWALRKERARAWHESQSAAQS